MKHPILWGAALTVALFAAGLAANAALARAAREHFRPGDYAWCEVCGRACLHGAYEIGPDGGRYVCGDDCMKQLPHDVACYWIEE